MSIPRWHHRLNAPGMFEDPEGVYVHHHSHAAAVARLREAGEKLDFFLHHDDHCPGIYERECTCGLDEALAAWRAAVKESE